MRYVAKTLYAANVEMDMYDMTRNKVAITRQWQSQRFCAVGGWIFDYFDWISQSTSLQ